MNRIVDLNFCLLFLLFFAGPVSAQLQIFTCEPEWAALAEELGGDAVEAESAITGVQDVHYIQARPSLIARVRRTDLVICTGAELEVGWLPLLLRQANNAAIQPGAPGFMAATDFVDLLEQPQAVDRALGDIHPFGNPHIQTDPRNILPVAAAMLDRLQTLDSANADHYAARYADFAARWEEAVPRWTARAEALRGRAIITHHRSWVYMIEWLGLDEVATLESKPGVPPSTSHLAGMLDQLQSQEVRVIVRSAYQNSRGSRWLSDRTGIPAVVVPHTIGSVDGADDLFSLFDVMLDVLLEPGT